SYRRGRRHTTYGGHAPQHAPVTQRPPGGASPAFRAHLLARRRYHGAVFGLIRNRRRRRILATNSLPDAAWQAAFEAVPVLRMLDEGERERLHDLTLLFLHEKRLEPAGGLELDDRMRVRIGALACLPILELGRDCYGGF